jgi:hypothetical protein
MDTPKDMPKKSLDDLLLEITESLRRVRENELILPARVFRREGDNFSVESFEREEKIRKVA